MEIKTVSIIGLGNLGILFGDHLSKRLPNKSLRILADKERIIRYREEQIYCNDRRCEFYYMSEEETCEPADLIIIAVKFKGLKDALRAIKNHVGENTLILSLLNGIVSEDIIAKTYGEEKVLCCVAQGMDTVKLKNRMSYKHMGMLCFGEREPGLISDKGERLARFFDRMEIRYEMLIDMYLRLWSKFMLNVGVNQTVAVIEGCYGDIQHEGVARETMIAAMMEVIPLAQREGIILSEADIQYWLEVLGRLRPEGKPSMRQDLEAKRYSEVDLFGGTVLQLGEKYGIDTPVNRILYDKILAIEKTF